MGKGGSYLAPYHAWEDKLPEDVKAMVAQRTQEIMDGTFRVPVDESTPQSE
jgi:basic membrane lipoprotein Med (substrate-binding protein (PBP1-ABC) superfamily)